MEEAFDLARQMTMERDGQVYVGLEFGGVGSTNEVALVPLRQLATNMTDPETQDVLLTQRPEFTQYLELMREYYSIPGIRPPESLEATLFEQKKQLL